MNVGTVMIAAQPEIRRTMSLCSTPITAMLACSTVVSRSRCAITSSLTSVRWSLTSRKYCAIAGADASRCRAPAPATGASSGCTAR